MAFFVLPYAAHGEAVLAYGNRDAQGRANFHAHRPNRIVESGVLAGMPGRRHPVGGELDLMGTEDARRGDIGDGFAHRHAGGSGGIEQGNGTALTQGHGLSRVGIEARGRHPRIGHGHLPRPHHLISGHESAHGAIADGDQEALVPHRGKLQYGFRGLDEIDGLQVQGFGVEGNVLDVTQHARGFAKEDGQGKVDGAVAKERIVQGEVCFFCGFPDDCERTALALAERLEIDQVFLGDGHHIAFLALVAPEFHGGHSAFGARNLAELKARAPVAVVYEFGQRVGQTAGADIVDGDDRIGRTPRPTTVDDLLAASFEFGVLSLNRGEIQIFVAGSRVHGGSSAATQADQHGGSAEHDDFCAGRNLALFHVLVANAAEPAREHDGLMKSANLRAARARYFFLEGSEVAGDIRPPEFVVVGRSADRRFQHDVQSRGDALGLAEVLLPGLLGSGNT